MNVLIDRAAAGEAEKEWQRITYQDVAEGTVLGTVRKPAEGCGATAAEKLNTLVRRIAVAYDWRHLVVRMHPATWSQVMPYLNYNLCFPRPGVPMDMDGGGLADPNRVDVVYREVVRHPY